MYAILNKNNGGSAEIFRQLTLRNAVLIIEMHRNIPIFAEFTFLLQNLSFVSYIYAFF